MSDAEYLAEQEWLQRELATLKASMTKEMAKIDRLAFWLRNVAQGWQHADQGERNRLARLLFDEIVIGEDHSVTVKPKPELAGFFARDEKERGPIPSGHAHRSGSDGSSLRVSDTPMLFPTHYRLNSSTVHDQAAD